MFKTVPPRLISRRWYSTPNGPAQVQKITSVLLGHLEKGQWHELRQHFHPILRWIATESVLRKGWGTVGMAAGPLQHVGESQFTYGWFTTAKVPLQFKRMKLALQVRMTESGKVVGINIVPTNLAGIASPWSAPLYVAVKEFREEAVMLGSWRTAVSGTLAVPNSSGRHPCVVLLPGSGPCDRDSTVGASKPFKDLAQGLASRGVAVLRFDKISYTCKAKFWNMLYMKMPQTLTEEYTDTANAAIHLCQQHSNIDADKIFVLGHSLGACVAPVIVEQHASVAGCIIMAGPADAQYYRAGLRQARYLSSMNNEPDTAQAEAIFNLQRQVDAADGPDFHRFSPKDFPFGISAKYWLDCHRYDPIGTASGLEKPVLILQGDRDYQVTAEHDYSRWKKGLESVRDVDFRLYDDLNHLFIKGDGPSFPLEYETPGNVDAHVIDDIQHWVHKYKQTSPRY